MFMFDNNLSFYIPLALKVLGEDTCHLQDHFRPDCPDEEWLSVIGEQGWFLITKDRNILKNKAEQIALRRHNVGAFFLKGKELTHWQIVLQVFNNWQKIKDESITRQRPFALLIPPHGARIETVF